MNAWDKALWMLEEGFTTAQLKKLSPSVADAYKLLKPMLGDQQKPSKEITKERKFGDRITMMKEAISNSHGDILLIKGEVYYDITKVRDAHKRSGSAFYAQLKKLVNDRMIIKYRKEGRVYMRLRGDDE